MTVALSARGMTVRFGDVEVLSSVDVEIASGSIHGLIGENGAGKSTLGKVLGGYYRASAGTLSVFGKAVVRWDPPSALAHGVAIMHQELQLVPYLTVAQNVFMGLEEHRFGVLRRNEAARLEALMETSGLSLDPNAVTADLSIADQQKIEILRALAREARVIVMDEPTSSLSNAEVAQLHRIMERLRDEGRTVIYVTHFLDHILETCDTVTVLRDGELVRTRGAKGLTKGDLVSDMLGGDKAETPFPAKVRPREIKPLFEVRNLKGAGVSVRSLTVGVGEIVGLIGLVGSGRTEIARAIVGADPVAGDVLLDGVPVPRDIASATAAGLVMVPEDRRNEGLVMTLPVRPNITLPHLRRFSQSGVMAQGCERSQTQAAIERFNVRPSAVDGDVSRYSGGNQQKVLLAKWLQGDPRIVVLDEPSRGVDVGAREAIHRAIAALAASGAGVLLISSEIEEVLGLAHRAYLVDRGSLIEEINPDEACEAEIMHALFRHQSLQERTA
ncbi:MAG: sugar ABC transporter ATP-binding protein [Pseudomonadota bacterium]